MTKVAIIGIHSFTGSSFAKHLLENGVQVIGFARSLETPANFLPHAQIPQGLLTGLKIYKANLLHDYQEISQEIIRNRTEIVLNFAAQSMVSESWETPEDWYETNITCFAKLVSGLLNVGTYKLNKFISFTTPEVYGNTTEKITENWQFKPTTPYAISRAAGDFHLKALYENFNFPVIFTRTANVYGPYQKLYRVIPKLITKMLNGEKFQLHGEGKSLRSFIHSEDVSSALMKIMQNGTIGESYHISTDHVVSIRELTEKTLSKLGLDFESSVELVPDRIGKDNAYFLDSKKLRRELDWKDSILLDQGLDQTIEWIQRDWKVLSTFKTDYVHTR